VNDLLIGLLSSLLASNAPAVVSNLVQKTTGVRITVTDPNDPVERELARLMKEDDAAQAEVDRWIQDRDKTGIAPGEVEKAALRAKIFNRFAPIKKGYDDLLNAHPNHARGRLAYGSFLSDIGEEEAAEAQWEKAREADPKNPAAWNNLANHYGHYGSVRKAFDYYAKAIELEPDESVYYQNLATIVFLFRKEAMEHYGISEQEVFSRSMALYRKALVHDPENFRLAAEVAQTYYGIKPPTVGDKALDRKAELKLAHEALAAWQAAFRLAGSDLERETIQLHFTRWQINSARFDEARQSLNLVTNAALAVSKRTLLNKLARRETGAKGTNNPAGLTGETPDKP
jgi:tetratricopeptide (TPR) repeat protein